MPVTAEQNQGCGRNTVLGMRTRCERDLPEKSPNSPLPLPPFFFPNQLSKASYGLGTMYSIEQRYLHQPFCHFAVSYPVALRLFQ